MQHDLTCVWDRRRRARVSRKCCDAAGAEVGLEISRLNSRLIVACAGSGRGAEERAAARRHRRPVFCVQKRRRERCAGMSHCCCWQVFLQLTFSHSPHLRCCSVSLKTRSNNTFRLWRSGLQRCAQDRCDVGCGQCPLRAPRWLMPLGNTILRAKLWTLSRAVVQLNFVLRVQMRCKTKLNRRVCMHDVFAQTNVAGTSCSRTGTRLVVAARCPEFRMDALHPFVLGDGCLRREELLLRPICANKTAPLFRCTWRGSGWLLAQRCDRIAGR